MTTITNTILIVDDEPNLRLTLGLILQKAGYTVTIADHPHKALQCLQAGPYDLVFLDLQMPDMDGLTLLGHMRRMYPTMPVIILTAHATLESSIEAVRMGARDYLLKPVDPPLILARVGDILSEQRQPQRRREIINQIQTLLAELQTIDHEPNAIAAIQEAIALPATSSARFLKRGSLTLDLHARYVVIEGKMVNLSPSSFSYLLPLARHSPDPLSYEALVLQAQGYRLQRSEAQEIVRWQIHQLRKSLEPDPTNPQYIITARNIGYRLVA